jgi:uncharacterized DUF497 family protein
MPFDFEWDPEKDASNWVKHKVRFDEAKPVFFDALSYEFPDEEHSEN